MVEIPLTQGKFALIDDEDYDMVSLFKWYIIKNFNTYYAMTKVTINKKRFSILMHRLILNAKPDELSDHKNHNGLDNRRENIRLCTQQQNCMNRKSRINTSSIYKGVYWHKRERRWRAQVKLNNKSFHLGYFYSEIFAAGVYDKKAKELFGEFARLNF